MEKIKNFLIEMSKTDKMAHFGIGGLICALFTFVVMIQDYTLFIINPFKLLLVPFLGTIVVVLVSVFKELVIDDKADWIDVIAALIGCLSIFVAILLGLIFYILSN